MIKNRSRVNRFARRRLPVLLDAHPHANRYELLRWALKMTQIQLDNGWNPEGAG